MRNAIQTITFMVILCLFSCAVMAGNNTDRPLVKSLVSRQALNAVKQYLLDNIATESHPFVKDNGGHALRSIPGAVLASPSNKGPAFGQDYQFHWVRDAAISMYEVTEIYAQASATDKYYLRPYLINYINFERIAQSQPSRSGEETLGQPKFNIDGSIWEGEWGRPQNDGPALRAITLIQIAKLFMQEGQSNYVRETMLPMVNMDLSYLVSHWQYTNFDLWEEVNDTDHFFTKMVQRKALKLGADFVMLFGDQHQSDIYTETANSISASLDRHWNDARGYYSETIYQQHYKGGGLDTSILLGVLLGDISDVNDRFAVSDSRIMSSVVYLRNSFAVLYRINLDDPRQPTMLGRYPSDVYDGDQSIYGNPWILTTNALAEYYYKLANSYLTRGVISIDKTTIMLLHQISSRFATKEETILLSDNPARFYEIVDMLTAEGDRLLRRVMSYSICYHEYSCYHLSEQIDRAGGNQVSARDLTWSYASLLSAVRSRQG